MQLRAIPLEPQTLPELLNLRGSESSAEIGILDAKGAVLKAYNYRKLFEEAQTCAERLISAGLEPNGKDIILTSFENHENHIILFWAGCLGNIFFYPIAFNMHLIIFSWNSCVTHTSFPSRSESTGSLL